MKKILLGISLIASLCACENLSGLAAATGGSDASMKAKLHSCLVNEASSRFQAGTLFNQGIVPTSKELAGTCIKKLALQSAGISEETQSMATSIIQNFQNFGSAQ